MRKNTKRLLSLLIAVAMVIGMLPFSTGTARAFTLETSADDAWVGYAAAAFAGGSGTSGDPYQIANAGQLAYLAKLVNTDAGPVGQAGTYFKLTADIDLTAHQWEPIGYYSHFHGTTHTFKGIFDGNGHKVTGMRLGGGYTAPCQNYSYIGLFGYTDGATIQNLGVSVGNSTYAAGISADARQEASIGALAGYAFDTTMKNCYSESVRTIDIGYVDIGYNYTDFGNAGGLVGTAESSTIDSCYSSASIDTNYESNSGGLIGHLIRGTVKNSYSTARVNTRCGNTKADGYGGFVGSNYGGTIENCYSRAQVYYAVPTGGKVTIGGFVALNHGIIKNCYSAPKTSIAVLDYTYGEFVGNNYGTSSLYPATILNCYSFYDGGHPLGTALDNEFTYADIKEYANMAAANSATSVQYFTAFTNSTTNTQQTAATFMEALNRGRAVTGDSSLYAWQADTASQNGGYPVFSAPPASSITLKNKTATYNGSAVQYGASDIATQIGSYGTVSFTYYSDAACTSALPSTPKDADTYYVKANVAADSLYSSAVSNVATLTINKATLTVTPTGGQQKLNGLADPTLSYTYAGNVTGETPGFTGQLSRGSGSTIGTYPINQGTLDMANNGSFLASNYTLSFDSSKSFAIVAYTPGVSAALSTPNGSNNWYTDNVTIKLNAPAGHQISSNGTSGWASSIDVNNTNGTGKTATYYLKRTADGAISSVLTSAIYNVDNTVPSGTINIGSNNWNSFLNSVTFGLFFKNTKTVTITPDSQVSGTTVQYLLSDTPINSTDISTKTGWQSYSQFSLSNNSKRYIYAKLTSGAGKVSYINSNGVVIYTDSLQATANLTHTRLAANDQAATVTLNGNTISKVNDGSKDLVLNTDYTVSGGSITFKAVYLNSLAAGSYTLTVSYNPLGESYSAAAGNDTPATTTINLSVIKADQASVTMSGIQTAVTYGIAPFTATAAGGNGTGTYFWSITEEKDSGGGTAATGSVATINSSGLVTIKGVGSFTVSVYRASDGSYNQSSAVTTNVTVSKKKITVSGITVENKTYDDTTSAVLNYGSVVFSGKLSGDTLTVSAIGAFNDKSAGAGKTVSISAIQLGGASAANYELALSGQQTTATASINPMPIIVGGIAASNKIYDSTTTSALDFNGVTFAGKFSSDTLTVSAIGVFTDKNVGTGKTVSISSIQIGGADADNYYLALMGQQTTATADITAAVLTATANNKTMLQGQNPPVYTVSVTGFLGGETAATALGFSAPTATCSAISSSAIGTYTITPAGGVALNYTFNYVAGTLTVSAPPSGGPGSGGSSGSGSSGAGSSGGSTPTAPAQTTTAAVTGPAVTPVKPDGGSSPAEITFTTSTEAKTSSTGTAVATVSAGQLTDAIKQAVEAAGKSEGTAANVEIKVNAPSDTKNIETSIPKAAVQAVGDSSTSELIISTPVASIAFDDTALDTISKQATADVKISASKIDSTKLSEEAKQTVGDRPVYNFSVTSGDKTISQFGGNVTVSIPYTPKPGEDINAIVIYYINAEGKLETVSNCAYDPAKGKITFITNHFSQYAVGYNKVNFNDVSKNDWYSDAVSFVAARGITSGAGAGQFKPEQKLTRGQFLVMVMKAYGIKPDANTKDNFADAGNTYYTNYLAAAKSLGITSGVGGNRYAPDKEITRQEMFTLLYNILKTLDKLPKVDAKKNLSQFSDSDSVAGWAKDSMQYFVGAGVLTGSNNKLNPNASTSRADLAQVLYNLLTKKFN